MTMKFVSLQDGDRKQINMKESIQPRLYYKIIMQFPKTFNSPLSSQQCPLIKFRIGFVHVGRV